MDILSLDLERKSQSPATPAELRFQAALLATAVSVGTALLLRFGAGAPLVPELMAHSLFSVVPIWLVGILVGLLGPFAKHLGFLACVVLYALGLLGAGTLGLRLDLGKSSRFLERAKPFLLAVTLWVLTLGVLVPALGGGLAGAYLQQGVALTAVSQAIVLLVYGGALALFRNYYIERTTGSGTAVSSASLLDRRRVVRWLGFAIVAVGAYDIGRSLLQSWLQRGSGRVSGGSGIFPDIDGLAREVTPVGEFYTVSKNPFDPQLSPRTWKLEIGGLVARSLSIGLEDIKRLPAVEHYATLECIDNRVGGNLIGNAHWRGVRLRDVLESAGLRAGVVDIVLRAADGYADSIPLGRALAEGTILAYEMNGAPLTTEHGFPMRLIVPGIYGMKNVKWITRIEAVDYDFKGYWQSRGWDDRAHYKTMSRIDAPVGRAGGEAVIAGIAFAGDRGVEKVEVSADAGRSWIEAEVRPALSRYSWVLWHYRWVPSKPGNQQLMVRATDGSGAQQTSVNAPPQPDGASGYHRVDVDVEPT